MTKHWVIYQRSAFIYKCQFLIISSVLGVRALAVVTAREAWDKQELCNDFVTYVSSVYGKSESVKGVISS